MAGALAVKSQSAFYQCKTCPGVPWISGKRFCLCLQITNHKLKIRNPAPGAILTQPKKFYSQEFKIQALRMVDEGKNVTEVALHFGIERCTLYRWHTKALAGKFPGFQPTRETAVETPRKFPTEFKIAKVKEIEAGKTISQVARETGVRRTVMQEWYDKFRDASRDPVHLGEAEAQQIVKTVRAQDAEVEEIRAQAARSREDEIRRIEGRIHRMTRDPLTWMQNHTETRDSHWREHRAKSPYRPFPDKPYFRPAIEDWQREKVVFIEKSRNMMLSWLCVGFFTHAAMTTPGIEVLFQSQKEEKAFELVDYAKTLYDRQDPELQEAFPLVKKLKDMADGELLFANGSRIVGIPGGADQIRSYHPWGLLMDEAAFMPEAGDCYNNAVSVCQKILVVSSAGPGWFGEVCNSGEPLLGNSTIPGFTLKKSTQGLIQRVHYSADPERGAEWAAEERKRYSSQGKWDREQEIIHEAGAGERIFAEVLTTWEDKILIDPEKSGFQVSPHWKRISAFDYGKANPTAALVAAIDQDANLYILSEYYQPGLSPRQHVPNLRELKGFMKSDALADPSIFYKSQAQSDGSFKAINDLYIQEGIGNLIQAPDNSEEAGMEKILNHWLDLDNREPTLRIICPRGLRGISKPIYGVHNQGCPNLLWELLRARREESSAGQLVNRNPTERVVDKDNHLRDCLKYLCLAFVEPAKQTPEMKANEAIKDIPLSDPTSRVIRWQDAYLKAKEEDTPKPIPLGRRGRYLLAKLEALKNRKLKNLFRDPS